MEFAARRRSTIHYAWIVAAVTFVTLLAAAGFRSTPGVLFVPLEQEFGWNRATIGLAVSINLLLFGFVGPFAATLMARLRAAAGGRRGAADHRRRRLADDPGASPWQLIAPLGRRRRPRRRLHGQCPGGDRRQPLVRRPPRHGRRRADRRRRHRATDLPAAAGLAGDLVQLAARLPDHRARRARRRPAGPALPARLAGRRWRSALRRDQGRPSSRATARQPDRQRAGGIAVRRRRSATSGCWRSPSSSAG